MCLEMDCLSSLLTLTDTSDILLKEAQEKTDEITAKFLDKEKDPLNYRPQPIVTASSESAPASAAAANASASLKREQANKALKKKSAATSKSGGRVKSSQQHQQVSLIDFSLECDIDNKLDNM